MAYQLAGLHTLVLCKIHYVPPLQPTVPFNTLVSITVVLRIRLGGLLSAVIVWCIVGVSNKVWSVCNPGVTLGHVALWYSHACSPFFLNTCYKIMIFSRCDNTYDGTVSANIVHAHGEHNWTDCNETMLKYDGSRTWDKIKRIETKQCVNTMVQYVYTFG